jgi:hypothetical protein
MSSFKKLTYDDDLHMYRQPPQSPNLNRLAYLRWLVERGRLDHPVAGPPSGPLAGPESPGDQTATS